MTAVLHGDCLAILPTLPPDSFDSCVTDPPYHLVSIVKRFGKNESAPAQYGNDGRFARASAGFMGKQWDGGDVAARLETWAAVYRVLKPGAHLVAFGGTRTYHRMACAIEDAGFEIRDCIQWIYGSGFPKSHDVGKGIDRQLGVEHERVVTHYKKQGPRSMFDGGKPRPASLPASLWQGWGTALKPACEPIVLARKPLSEGTVAANVLRWGTGAINVDGCRVETDDRVQSASAVTGFGDHSNYELGTGRIYQNDKGRWPANVVHDGSDEVVQGFPDTTSGDLTSYQRANRDGYVGPMPAETNFERNGDSGSAARFFYTAKADGDERIGSKHPTVKPIDLMQWLVRLVTPKGGTTLDPFAGTGTTGEAAWREGCQATLIERETEYLSDIARRMELMKAGPDERAREIVKASGKAQGHEDLPLFDRAWSDMWAKPFDKPELVWGKK